MKKILIVIAFIMLLPYQVEAMQRKTTEELRKIIATTRGQTKLAAEAELRTRAGGEELPPQRPQQQRGPSADELRRQEQLRRQQEEQRQIEASILEQQRQQKLLAEKKEADKARAKKLKEKGDDEEEDFGGGDDGAIIEAANAVKAQRRLTAEAARARKNIGPEARLAIKEAVFDRVN